MLKVTIIFSFDNSLMTMSEASAIKNSSWSDEWYARVAVLFMWGLHFSKAFVTYP